MTSRIFRTGLISKSYIKQPKHNIYAIYNYNMTTNVKPTTLVSISVSDRRLFSSTTKGNLTNSLKSRQKGFEDKYARDEDRRLLQKLKEKIINKMKTIGKGDESK